MLELLTREVRIPVVVQSVETIEGGEHDGKRGILLDNEWILMLAAKDGMGGLFNAPIPTAGQRLWLGIQVMIYGEKDDVARTD